MRDLAFALAIGLAAAAARGEESFWIGGGGFFDDPANWTGPVPDETVTAILDVDLDPGPFVTFRVDGVCDRLIARAGAPYLTFWDTDKQGEHFAHGLEAVNPFVTTPSIVVADLPGTAVELHIDSGVLVCESFVLAAGAGSVAAVGFGSLFDLVPGLVCGQHLHVGAGGTGTLPIGDRIVVTAGVAILGVEPGSWGEVTVLEAGSALEIAGELTVGKFGGGLLAVADEADLTSGTTLIGQSPGSSGAVVIDGLGASWLIDGSLDVGYEGAGTLEIIDALVITSGFATIGTLPEPGVEPQGGGTGVVTVSGPTAFWGVTGDLYASVLWDGTLEVLDGAAVASQSGFVGLSQNAVGHATVQGAGSAWSTVGELVVGATLTLADGGLVIADEVAVLEDGVLEGDGTVDGDLLLDGELRLGLAGTDTFDALTVLGDALLSGTLGVTLEDGFVPDAGDRFEVLTAALVDGGFAATDLPALPPPLLWILDQGPASLELLVSQPGDVDGDGLLGINDFLALLAAWGPCPPPPESCPSDIDGDGIVGIVDLLLLLMNWG